MMDKSTINLIDNRETAQEDDGVLGVEMLNVCLENTDKTREALGEELCLWCLKNYKGLRNLSSILDSYVDTYENDKKNKDKLKQLIKVIAFNNYDAKITPLISASGAKDEIFGLSELFERAKINYIQDVLRLLALTINEKDYVKLVRFIKWLSEDKKAILRSELHHLSKKDRDEEIIRKRAKGGTLAETSTDYAMTHEGVRQIEKKFQGRFDRYITEIMPHYILYAFSQNTGYISLRI